MTYKIEHYTRRAADGRRLTHVGIEFDGQWCGYFRSFLSALSCLTIRKVPVDEARRAIAPHFPNSKEAKRCSG